MDSDVTSFDWVAEYKPSAEFYEPSSSAETAQASFNSVSNLQAGPECADGYHGVAPGSQWPEASSFAEASQNAFCSGTGFQPDAKHVCRYPDIQYDYTSSEPSSHQASEPLFSSPVRSQDAFNSFGAVQYDSKPDNEYQVARPIVARCPPTLFPLTGSNIVHGNPVAAVDPALFHPLMEHFGHLTELKDLVVAAGQTAKEHEARIKADLLELWADNANIRPRGLVGGTARKNRSVHGDYVKFKETAAISQTFLAHRMEVEKKDLLGRSRQHGLKFMAELCSVAQEWLQKQLDHCESLLGYASAYNAGFYTENVMSKLSDIENTLFGEETVRKVDDIEKMLRVFRAEYDATV